MDKYYYIAVCSILLYFFFPISKKRLFRRLFIIRTNYRLIAFFSTIVIVSVLSISNYFFTEYFDEEAKNPYKHDWTNPEDVIYFPFQQLDVIINKPEETKISFARNKATVNYIFILDKTKSIEKLDTLSDENKKALIENLYKDFKDTNLVNSNIKNLIEKKLKKMDLYILFFIKQIYESAYINSNSKIIVYHYYGDELVVNDDNIPHIKEVISKKKSELSYEHILNVISDSTEKFTNIYDKKSEHYYTNIKTIFEEINKNNLFANIEGAEKTKNSLLLYSDFAHEEKSNTKFKALESYLEYCNKVFDLNKICLVKVNSDKHDKNFEQNEESSEKTIEIMRNHFTNNFINIFQEDNLNLDITEEFITHLRHVVSISEMNEENAMHFFSPGLKSDRYYSAESIAKIDFGNQSNTDSTFIMSLISDNKPFNEQTGRLVLNKKMNLIENQPYYVKKSYFDTTLKAKVNVNTLSDDKYNIEILPPSDIISVIIPIKFRKKFPISIILILCVSYTIIFYLLSVNAFFYMRTGLLSIIHKKDVFEKEFVKGEESQLTTINKRKIFFFYFFIIIYVLFFLIYALLTICLLIKFCQLKLYMPLLVLILLFLLYVWIFGFRRDVKKEFDIKEEFCKQIKNNEAK